ncbi:MAG: bifunctional 2-polyprenyl-6-hydroxyphenol methylase/3-demethylubiquinol 3-O-methyltransferase UbiG [Bosea sp.]|jgi:2-polyprenyl-6-hydroxyphenyl methylase/3-demethylubiquinone-9 3-methyltransferase|nr:bifunctional 2-polyprenyl-6-hydroxyphenol methylase/3-demethylubiquinol 3-O-methyltransferase UbiG [Bosea sp. (in: a-proteobacteria)]
MSRQAAQGTIDAGEVERFDALAERWWDPEGPMKPLHGMNPVRLRFIREQALAHFGRDGRCVSPFEGLDLVDVGCGGGLLSEPMARLGARVTGLDPATRNIGVARAHAARMELAIDYRDQTIESVVEAGERFDMVMALEVIEHVADAPAFLGALSKAAKPGGLVVMSTLNRSLRAFGAAIIGAEYVLRWLPRGTHDWNKFVRPEELAQGLERAGLPVLEMRGMAPDLMNGGWRLSGDMAVNYIVAAARPR